MLYDTVRRVYSNCLLFLFVEMCMEMGTNGIPCVPWESDGNGSDNDYNGNRNGSGNKSMGMGIELWESERISIAAFQRIICMKLCSVIRELGKQSF